MVDRERVDRLLARLADDLRVLSEYRRHGTLSRTELAAVKYHFITAIEGCARIAHHLISSEGWPVAETNADALRRLGEQGVLDAATATSAAASVGFRNVLVHQYAEVDDTRVAEHLHRLGDLDALVRAVAGWLSEQN